MNNNLYSISNAFSEINLSDISRDNEIMRRAGYIMDEVLVADWRNARWIISQTDEDADRGEIRYENALRRYIVKTKENEDLKRKIAELEVVKKLYEGEIIGLHEEFSKNIECPICLENIQNVVIFTDCGHKYCKSCYDRIDTCAICRKSLNKPSE